MHKAYGCAIAVIAAVAWMAPAHAKSMSYSVHHHRYVESPAANNYRSAQYDYRLQTNLRFRHYRMWKECHTIDWAPLHGDCLASFDQYEPILR